ncbi:MAG TPA: PRC-barrel domain-containing protein [Solirubrobacterales bacterium]
MSELIGSELDDVAGGRVGRVAGFYLDAANREPVWLVVALGRRGKKTVVVPIRECAAGAGRTWTAQEAKRMQAAPAVDPSRPLLREHELTICGHYGIGERVGRHAEVAARAEGEITAQPA